jgi:hypothetical protein
MANLWIGAAAGAAGTAALDIVTYADMVIRGRPASDVPTETAERLARKVGIGFGASRKEPGKAWNREEALGALLGYAAGLGVGMLYALARPLLRDIPTPVAGLGLAVAAMAAGDLPSIAAGATDPRRWGVAGWIGDIVPHLVYGIVAAEVFDAIAERIPPPRVLRRAWRRTRAFA